jgi:subtilisin family serine protease
VKVLNCAGSGAFSWVIAGILHAVNTGNDVINMSLGAVFPKNATGGGQLVAALNKAVNYAQTQGVLVVSAAGNSAIDLDKDGNLAAVPCQSGSGMCVGATARGDALSSFSNHGLSGPQITAPGGGNNRPLSRRRPPTGSSSPRAAGTPSTSRSAGLGSSIPSSPAPAWRHPMWPAPRRSWTRSPRVAQARRGQAS